MVYDHKTPRIYLNGAHVRSGSVSGSTHVVPPIHLGARSAADTSNMFQGDVASFAIYDRALTSEQIHRNCTATQGGFSGASCSAASLTATQLKVNGPETVSAGVCSGPYEASLRDGSGLLTEATSAVTANLTGAGTLHYFSASDCNAPSEITSVGIASGAAKAVFYARNTGAASLTFTATDAAATLTAGTLNVTATSEPVKIKLTMTDTASSGACVPMTIATVNSAGTPVSTSGGISLNLQHTTTAALGTGNFYSDAGCATPDANPSIGAGSSSITHYYKPAATPGFHLIEAGDASGMPGTMLEFGYHYLSVN
jgi:hypothetical protein